MNAIATAAGSCNTADDVTGISNTLGRKLTSGPTVIISSYSSLCDHHMLIAQLRKEFPSSSIMGASTCRGSLTNEGIADYGNANLTLWGLCDNDGDYGVGFAPFDSDIEKSSTKALEDALQSSGRGGELPDLVWMHAAPGNEELVVATLDTYFGGDVLIVGGSAADEALEGKWTCFADDQCGGNGVAIMVMFSSYDITTSFQSGYVPGKMTGIATRCQGRTVYEIDYQPAAKVYNEWTNGLIDLENTRLPVNVLGSSTLSPLGISVGQVSGVPYYSLVHPETYTEDYAMSFFCEVNEGDSLTLMNGSIDNIVSRPCRVANEAIFHPESSDGDVVGGLVVFCGGCLLAVESRADEIATELNATMGDYPYLGCFTFGEQGNLLGGENRHGNLMISVTIFKEAA